MNSIVYLLDANVFIEAANRYYAFDLVPAFWTCLLDYAKEGYIKSIDRVKEELAPRSKRGKEDEDELAIWARTALADAFASTNDSHVVDAWRKVTMWATRGWRFSDQEKTDFCRATNADAWLVAYACVNGYTIVTHEQPAPEGSKIKLPDVCFQFEVPYVDTFEMLRELEFCL